MNLNKTQIAQLNDILSNLKIAEKHLQKDSTIICRKNITASKEDTFSNGIDTLTPMAKFIGSELNYLPNAIEKLSDFINTSIN